MKRIISSRSLPTLAAWAHRSARISAVFFAVASAYLMASSCIYDKPPDDEFYRTLWKSDEVPLGPFDASSLTLEFLCGEGVSIKTTTTSADTAGPSAFGTYSFDGATAVFDNLEIKYGSDSIRTGTATPSSSSGGSKICFTRLPPQCDDSRSMKTKGPGS